MLVGSRWRCVAVVVESGFADRDYARVFGQSREFGGSGFVETFCRIGMSTDCGEDTLGGKCFGVSNRFGAARFVESDVQQSGNAGTSGTGYDFFGIRIAVGDVAVTVDHPRKCCTGVLLG